MQKGLAWFVVSETDSAYVVVESEHGKEDVLPAVQYVVKGIEPPIYELPRRQEPSSTNG
jgi:hypothetical protein